MNQLAGYLNIYKEQASGGAATAAAQYHSNPLQQAPLEHMEVDGGAGQMGGARRRTFTVESAMTADRKRVPPGGVYRSHDPLSAAKKASRKLFDKAAKTARHIHFVLRETTRGSPRKEYAYEGVKHKLATPKTLTYGDRVVHLHHRFDVRAE